MQGQDAVNVARAFNEALPLTGIVLTKLDGDARGGAALSVRQVTGKPIKFVGVGEKIDGLEAFHPERMASRILGMGDVARRWSRRRAPRSTTKEAQKLAEKMEKGKGFDLEDFKTQIAADEEDGRRGEPDGQAARAAHADGRRPSGRAAGRSSCAASRASSTR